MMDPKKFDTLVTSNWSSLPLHKLLSQPVQIDSFQMIPNFDVFYDWRSFTDFFIASPFHLEKVKGYAGIRATMVVRLVVNADKYTQGRLLLFYQPYEPILVEKQRNDFRLASQLQHVEIDLNSESEVSLRIPFRGPITHFDLTNNWGNPGKFKIVSSLPLRGSTSNITIYQSLEDVDLMGPTATSTATYQSGLQTIEEENEPLSKKVSKLSTALYSVAKVPILTPIVEPMAWATALSASVMSIFGFSKPLQSIAPTMTHRKLITGYNTSDGVDVAEQLALTKTTGVRVSDQVGLTNEDEMSLAYLLGIKSYLYRQSISVGQTAGTKILTFALSPWLMAATGSITDTVVAHPMRAMANLFSLYRGSIEMTVHLSKTVFHTGRLMVVFEPILNQRNVEFPTRINSVQDAVNCHRDIVDIRKGNTFSFKFPFVSSTPYLDVRRAYGFVHVFILNPLVKTDASVSDNVDIGYKFSACEDMEFAAPSNLREFPYEPAALDLDIQVPTIRPVTLPNVVYQSGLEVGNNVIVSKVIGTASEPVPNNDLCQLCIGEKIMSVKQIAMRQKLVWFWNGAVGDVKDTPPCDMYAVDPIVSTTFGIAVNNTPYLRDFYSYIGSMYAYSRGGVIVNVENVTNNSTLGVAVVNDGYKVPLNTQTGFFEWSLKHFILPSGTDRMYLPSYSHSHVRYNVPSYDVLSRDQAGSQKFHVGLNNSRFHIFSPITGTINVGSARISRGAAEDTQFGHFTGVPLMVRISPLVDDTNLSNDYKFSSYQIFPNS